MLSGMHLKHEAICQSQPPSNHLLWHSFQWNVLNKGWLLFVLFLSFFKFLISHLVMLQPPCSLGQYVCCITYQWPDISVGLHNDDFSWIWVAICKIFVGNSCLNLNLKSNISNIYCLHGHGIYSLKKEAESFRNPGFKFEMIQLVAWVGFITQLAQKLSLIWMIVFWIPEF